MDFSFGLEFGTQALALGFGLWLWALALALGLGFGLRLSSQEFERVEQAFRVCVRTRV